MLHTGASAPICRQTICYNNSNCMKLAVALILLFLGVSTRQANAITEVTVDNAAQSEDITVDSKRSIREIQSTQSQHRDYSHSDCSDCGCHSDTYPDTDTDITNLSDEQTGNVGGYTATPTLAPTATPSATRTPPPTRTKPTQQDRNVFQIVIQFFQDLFGK